MAMVAQSFSYYRVAAKSDTVNELPYGNKMLFDAIYVGGAGVVEVIREDGTAILMTAVAGGYLYVRGKRIGGTNTTATLINVLWM
jgi:hypothetical protein